MGRFFRTGDVGYMDEDGFIFIVDRIKDMINASGFKIYPRRIEDALYEHAAVAEVTVIGIPDDYRGEAPKAFVKLKEGQQATAEELLAFLGDKLSKIELAGGDRVPRHAAENHDRQALQEGASRRSEILRPASLAQPGERGPLLSAQSPLLAPCQRWLHLVSRVRLFRDQWRERLADPRPPAVQ